MQQVIHNLIQVLFAVNRVYFPGDKKLAHALGHPDRSSSRFAERIQGLLLPEERVSVQFLRRQQTELRRLLEEVEHLTLVPSS